MIDNCNTPRFLLAPDSFKGTLTAGEVCDIIGRAIFSVIPGAKIKRLPAADGGEGLSSTLHKILGGRWVRAIVSGVFNEPMNAGYAILPNGTAVIDMSACAGLPLAGENKNPAEASTRGVGELIKDAVKRGSNTIILGLGGSATNDCGIGMAAALGYRFLDCYNKELNPVGSSMSGVERILRPKVMPTVTVTAACDVDNPLFGGEGAAYVFAPQKGADSRMVKELDDGLRNMAAIIQKDLKIEVGSIAGAGAAGGMGAGVAAFLGGTLRSGIDLMLDAGNFDALMEDADYVITGEGRMDAQSVRGKVPAGVAERAAKKGKPVIAVCGSLGEGAEKMADCGITAMYAATDKPLSIEELKLTCREDLFKITVKAIKDLQLSGQSPVTS
jgi:glycerate 2-kinase